MSGKWNNEALKLGLRAEFATYAGGDVDYWILREDQSWHDAVRGDGHSYSPSGYEPRTMYPRQNESAEHFRKRAAEAARVANELRYVIAYRGASTGGWVMRYRFVGPDARSRAYSAFDRVSGMDRADVAIFCYRGESDWRSGKIERSVRNLTVGMYSCSI